MSLLKSYGRLICLAVSVIGLVLIAGFQQPRKEAAQAPTSLRSITPIFNQLVSVEVPSPFRPVFSQMRGSIYIQNWVPLGESDEQWTERITIMGIEDLVSSSPKVTPELLAGSNANTFEENCSASRQMRSLGARKLNGSDAFALVVSCTGGAPGKASQSKLVVAIRGARDAYFVEWAEMTKSSASQTPIDVNKWSSRLEQLKPILICPIVPGEPAPYSSCLPTDYKQERRSFSGTLEKSRRPTKQG